MFQTLTFLLAIQYSMRLFYVLITFEKGLKLWLNSELQLQTLRHVKEYCVLSGTDCKFLGAGTVFSSA